MIGRLNHIAIAVPNLESASSTYKKMFGATVSKEQSLPEHGVRVVFVELSNTKIELITPLTKSSPINSFLKQHKKGGIHHICYEVEDIYKARDHLLSEKATVIGENDPQIGAHGKPVIFLHPKDFDGTLIELQQTSKIKENEVK